MKLFFDNLQLLNQEFGAKLIEFLSTEFENKLVTDVNWTLLHVNRIVGLPAFYMFASEGVVIGALDYNHDLQIDTISYDELVDGDENLAEVVNSSDKVKEIIKNEAKDDKEYHLLQEVEKSIKRSVYALLLTNWYELQNDVDSPEKLHQMIFADLMVLDNELASMIKMMSEKDPEKTFNIVADAIAHNGLDNPKED